MQRVVLTYPAPIPVGHRLELTWFVNHTPPEKRRGIKWREPHTKPVVKDLDTGIVYMNHNHVSTGMNGGNQFVPNDYPMGYRSDLQVLEVWTVEVLACQLVFIEGMSVQHTMLDVRKI